jgi:predicted RNA-binding Zn-ribbon protein involved in translation (DUF1610 family)
MELVGASDANTSADFWCPKCNIEEQSLEYADRRKFGYSGKADGGAGGMTSGNQAGALNTTYSKPEEKAQNICPSCGSEAGFDVDARGLDNRTRLRCHQCGYIGQSAEFGMKGAGAVRRTMNQQNGGAGGNDEVLGIKSRGTIAKLRSKGWECLECGKKFSTVGAAERASQEGCPGCGGVDVDLKAFKGPLGDSAQVLKPDDRTKAETIKIVRRKGDWKESDHPRAADGKFGSGGGGGKRGEEKVDTGDLRTFYNSGRVATQYGTRDRQERMAKKVGSDLRKRIKDKYPDLSPLEVNQIAAGIENDYDESVTKAERLALKSTPHDDKPMQLCTECSKPVRSHSAADHVVCETSRSKALADLNTFLAAPVASVLPTKTKSILAHCPSCTKQVNAVLDEAGSTFYLAHDNLNGARCKGDTLATKAYVDCELCSDGVHLEVNGKLVGPHH